MDILLCWRAKIALVSAVTLLAMPSAYAYEFGCLLPDSRDGSFFVRGAWDVVDGDTVKVGAYTVDLISIDAPEIDQRCRSDKGEEFACGALVRDLLRDKFLQGGPVATCLVHFIDPDNRGEGFCGEFAVDPYLKVECVLKDYGGELARDGYARAKAVGEFPTSELYWAGHDAIKARRGLFSGEILPLNPKVNP